MFRFTFLDFPKFSFLDYFEFTQYNIENRYQQDTRILFIKSGTADFIVDDKTFTAQPGDLLMIPCGCMVTVKSSPNEKFCFYGVGFNCQHTISNTDFSDKITSYPYFVLDYHNRISSVQVFENLFAKICHTYKNNLIHQTFSDFFRLTQAIKDELAENTTNNPVTFYANSIKEILETNYIDYNLSISVIAKTLNISVNYASSVFKLSTGETINYALNRIRVEKAKELISLSAMSMNEIAVACGFKTQQYFTKVFLKQTSMTPTQYLFKIKNANL